MDDQNIIKLEVKNDLVFALLNVLLLVVAGALLHSAYTHRLLHAPSQQHKIEMDFGKPQ